ncbi:MAG: excisionase family DNA binding protein [Pirellulaceae bacterium]|jgi:excisionase family DNA binding protein
MLANLQEGYLTPTQVAKQLGVHVGTVHRWMYSTVRGRKLKSVLVGGRRRIIKSDLEAFLSADVPSTDNVDASRMLKARESLASFGVRTPKNGGRPA